MGDWDWILLCGVGGVVALLLSALHRASKRLLYRAPGVQRQQTQYTDLFNEEKGGDVTARKAQYMPMVNAYYNLGTDFYEWGWGKSFHFGRRFAGETLAASLTRHEHWLASKGNFHRGQHILDVGCGVGGPMRCIARFTEASILGINNNAYQISRGTSHNLQEGLSSTHCAFKQSDFMELAVPSGSMDGAYAIEATCHAPDKVACFREIFRALKPGAVFVGYEWCMTDKFSPRNPEHLRIKRGIEIGDSLPDMCHTSEVDRALEAAGFTLIEAFDISVPDALNPVPWYATLEAGYSPSNFVHSRAGIFLTHCLVWILETLRLAPKGTTATHEFLTQAPPNLVAGGKSGIFTPMYYFKATKPLK